MKKQIIILGFVLLALACKSDPTLTITAPEDYNVYLNTSEKNTLKEALSAKEFWSKRLRPDSTGVGDLAPLAGAYEQLFAVTGDPDHLKSAELLYVKGMEISAISSDAYARGLAHNYISQHRFKEAYSLLNETLEGPSNKHETRLMLFDAAMEVGDYEKAYEHLEAVKDLTDYHYLIRLSKWSDYRGDLDSAIKYLEKARDIANSRDSKPLRVWTYSNLADYYGHAGRITDSYQHYLKTLALQPDNHYAKKGIAWIIYSEENNTNEAIRILDKLVDDHSLPDYHLLKAEMYEHDGYTAKAEQSMNDFLEAVESSDYGDMYNTYLIEYFSETNPQQALELAQKELENRATPETYHLLALAQLYNGKAEEALVTIENHVTGKTSEPMALYHTALVYKANKWEDKLKPIKAELLDASFELGPVLTKKIEAL